MASVLIGALIGFSVVLLILLLGRLILTVTLCPRGGTHEPRDPRG